MVSPGEFETCPDWVPTLDRRPRCARISPKTIDVCGFDQRVNWPQKFETCPDWGAKVQPFENIGLQRGHKG
jgi:hypothetical protein